MNTEYIEYYVHIPDQATSDIMLIGVHRSLSTLTKCFVWKMTPVEFADQVANLRRQVRDSNGNIIYYLDFMELARNCRHHYLDQELTIQYHNIA